MAEPIPAWRRLFDAAERAVGPPLEEMVRSEQFAMAVGLVRRVQREVTSRSERASRQFLHVWNLPAGSDVGRLVALIASLEREVRQLRKQITDVQAEAAPRPAAAGPTREVTRAATPRRQRAPRPSAS